MWLRTYFLNYFSFFQIKSRKKLITAPPNKVSNDGGHIYPLKYLSLLPNTHIVWLQRKDNLIKDNAY